MGKFMIFTTDADISRRVFSYNDPDTLLMAVHPSGKNILGEGNLAFMHGPPHKAIRKSFLSLFTRKALATYVELQDGIIRDHLKQWQQVEGERDIRLFARCFTCAVLACLMTRHHRTAHLSCQDCIADADCRNMLPYSILAWALRPRLRGLQLFPCEGQSRQTLPSNVLMHLSMRLCHTAGCAELGRSSAEHSQTK